jgi:hypothetical protein
MEGETIQLPKDTKGVILPFTASDYPFVIFWSLYCLSFHLRLLITPLLYFGHCIVSPKENKGVNRNNKRKERQNKDQKIPKL